MPDKLKEKLEAAIKRELDAHKTYLAALQATMPFDSEGIDVPDDALSKEKEAYDALKDAQYTKQSVLDAIRARLHK